MIFYNFLTYISEVYTEASSDTNDLVSLSYSDVFGTDHYIRRNSIDPFYFVDEDFINRWNRYKNKDGKTEKGDYASTAMQWYNIGQSTLSKGISYLESEILNKSFGISNDDNILINATCILNKVYLNILNRFYYLPDSTSIANTVFRFMLKSKEERKKLSEEKIIQYCLDYFIYNVLSINKKEHNDPLIYKKTEEYFNNIYLVIEKI